MPAFCYYYVFHFSFKLLELVCIPVSNVNKLQQNFSVFLFLLLDFSHEIIAAFLHFIQKWASEQMDLL